jgi:hypothetical protein
MDDLMLLEIIEMDVDAGFAHSIGTASGALQRF